LGTIDNRIDQAGVIPRRLSPTELAADILMLGDETKLWAQNPWFWVLGPIVHTLVLEGIDILCKAMDGLGVLGPMFSLKRGNSPLGILSARRT